MQLSGKLLSDALQVQSLEGFLRTALSEIAAELSVDADHNRIAEKIQQTVKNFGQHLVPKEDIDLAMIANSTGSRSIH